MLGDASDRRSRRNLAAVLSTLLPLVVVLSPASGEIHYSESSHNRRSAQHLAFPLSLKKTVQSPPSREGWHLWSRGRLIFSRSESLIGLDPESGLTTPAGVEAVSADDGSTLRKHPIGYRVSYAAMPTTIDEDRVYVQSEGPSVTALRLKTGERLWESAPISSRIDPRHPFMATADGIVVPLYDGLAMLSKEGKLRWSRQYAFLKMRQVLPSLLATADAIVIGGKDGVAAVSSYIGTKGRMEGL